MILSVEEIETVDIVCLKTSNKVNLLVAICIMYENYLLAWMLCNHGWYEDTYCMRPGSLVIFITMNWDRNNEDLVVLSHKESCEVALIRQHQMYFSGL